MNNIILEQAYIRGFLKAANEMGGGPSLSHSLPQQPSSPSSNSSVGQSQKSPEYPVNELPGQVNESSLNSIPSNPLPVSLPTPNNNVSSGASYPSINLGMNQNMYTPAPRPVKQLF